MMRIEILRMMRMSIADDGFRLRSGNTRRLAFDSSAALLAQAIQDGSYSLSLSKGYNINMPTWRWYVYIVECHDKSYYTGLTWQPNTRWTQHRSGMGSVYTAKH